MEFKQPPRDQIKTIEVSNCHQCPLKNMNYRIKLK